MQLASFLFSQMNSRLRQRARGVRDMVRLWTSDRRVAIWSLLSAVVMLIALVIPLGWVRGHDDTVTINLIDFFARGVLLPQMIFLVASGVGLMVSWRWLPLTGILCLSTAWYCGVLTGSAWLFFVEHVQIRIATTFLDFWTPARTTQFLTILAWPLQPLAGPFDYAAMFKAATGAENLAATVMWRNFVLAALFVYTVLPRLGLLVFGFLRIVLATGARVAMQQVVGWRPQFSQPELGSIEWFETQSDEQQCTHAFIATGLRGRLEQALHLNALVPEWRRVVESDAAFAHFLAHDVKGRCPKVDIIAFDAARFDAFNDKNSPSLKSLYLVKLRRALGPAAINWVKVERALRDVAALEKELTKGPFSWKRWLSVAGLGAVGVGAGVALAPFIGAASIVGCVAVAKGTTVAAILSAAGGGALGATTGAALPLGRGGEPNVLVPLLARQIGLLSAGLVPSTAAAPLARWLEQSLEVEAGRANDRDKGACQVFTAARRILMERGVV